MRKLLVVMIALILIGCSRGIDDIPYQERYKMAYALSLCSSMGNFVDAYKADPFKNTWIYSHGITTIEDRDKLIKGFIPISMEAYRGAYRIPSDFSPKPNTYSIDEISSSCPAIAEQFNRIPFQ